MPRKKKTDPTLDEETLELIEWLDEGAYDHSEADLLAIFDAVRRRLTAYWTGQIEGLSPDEEAGWLAYRQWWLTARHHLSSAFVWKPGQEMIFWLGHEDLGQWSYDHSTECEVIAFPSLATKVGTSKVTSVPVWFYDPESPTQQEHLVYVPVQSLDPRPSGVHLNEVPPLEPVPEPEPPATSPVGRKRRRKKLMAESTLGAMSGHCTTALQIAQGTISSSKDPDHFHHLCGGVLERPDDEQGRSQAPVACPCECHADERSEALSDAPRPSGGKRRVIRKKTPAATPAKTKAPAKKAAPARRKTTVVPGSKSTTKKK